MIFNIKFSVFAILILLFTYPAHANKIHLFYMHGSNLDGGGGKKGEKKGYHKIISKLKGNGFHVISEIRPRGTVDEYALKVANKVNGLIENGVKPTDIVVSGFSKGAVISLISAALIGNPDVKYVPLAGCTDMFDVEYERIKGNILSIYDVDDHKFGSCEDLIQNNNSVKLTEIKIDSGHGHKIFKRKKDKLIRVWMKPMIDWMSN